MDGYMDTTADIRQLANIIQGRLATARMNIIARHFMAGQKASGRTAESIYTEVNVEHDSLHATMYGRQFFQGLETGRRGGKVPRGFYHMIKQWSKDKGIQFGKESERNTFAYFVAKKIAEEGTKLSRMGGRNDIFTPELNNTMNDIQEAVSSFMGMQMNHISLGYTK